MFSCLCDVSMGKRIGPGNLSTDFNFLFGQGGEAAPDLKGVTLASDCEYWKPSFVFEAGANILAEK